jgi:hypothetical protein
VPVSTVTPEVLSGVTQRVVDLFTREGLLFTALDVSNAVKGTLPSVRHREVSPLVRDLFASGAMGDRYRQTLIDVVADRKTVQAFLYHLEGADLATGYDEERRRQLAIPPVSLTETDVDDADEAALTVGGDGRLRVPRALLERASVTTHDVKLERVGDELLVGLVMPGTPVPPGVTLVTLSHPSLLHVPASLASMFDANAPITARVERFHVRITGTLAGG